MVEKCEDTCGAFCPPRVFFALLASLRGPRGRLFLEAVVQELPHPTLTCVGLSCCSMPEQSDSTEAHRRVEPPVVGLKVGVVRRWRRPDLQTIGGWGPTSKLLKVKT